ncbi:MAG: superoxide dismutase [Chloroflexi bacterium]|nr:superoxide dismutase [Chloroflexota bacterium]
MKIIALEVPVPDVDGSKFAPHIKPEAKRVWDMLQSGELREIYRRTDGKGHVLVFECASIDEAQSLVDSLPLVQQKLIAFDLIPLGAYPGLARLFADS